MKKQDEAYWALMEVARREKTTVQEVIRNIDEAIREAYHDAQKRKDTTVLAAWETIPCKGDLPTAVELVACLRDRMKQNRNVF